MKIVTYNEMIQQPPGAVCAAYYNSMLGDIFVIDSSIGMGFLYVKYLTPTVRDGIFLSWEYVDDNNFDIADMYGDGEYAILDKDDINNIINELSTWLNIENI